MNPKRYNRWLNFRNYNFPNEKKIAAVWRGVACTLINLRSRRKEIRLCRVLVRAPCKEHGRYHPDGIFMVHYCIKHFGTQSKGSIVEGNNRAPTGPMDPARSTVPLPYYRVTIGRASIKRSSRERYTRNRIRSATFHQPGSTVVCTLFPFTAFAADPRYLLVHRTENYYNCSPRANIRSACKAR